MGEGFPEAAGPGNQGVCVCVSLWGGGRGAFSFSLLPSFLLSSPPLSPPASTALSLQLGQVWEPVQLVSCSLFLQMATVAHD